MLVIMLSLQHLVICSCQSSDRHVSYQGRTVYKVETGYSKHVQWNIFLISNFIDIMHVNNQF